MSDPRIIPYRETVPQLGSGSFVADTARVIGDVRAGDACSFWYGTVVRGDVHPIRIGHRVNLQDMVMVHVTTGRYATTIEDEVTIGHRATLHGCTIKRRALIGMGAIILDGAVIGEEAMVAAGALVPPGMVVEPGTLVVGSPARPRRAITDAERSFLAHSAEHYANIAGHYLAKGHGVVDENRR